MTASPQTPFQLALLGREAVLKMLGWLAVWVLALGALDAYRDVLPGVAPGASLLLGTTFALLAWALAVDQLGLLAAQRLGVVAAAVFVLGGIGSDGAAHDATASSLVLFTKALWLVPLTVWMFICIPRGRAAAASLALATAVATALWAAAPTASPGLHSLALQGWAVMALLCGLLYTVAGQVRRLAAGGGTGPWGQLRDRGDLGAAPSASAQADAQAVRSVDQLVWRREAALRRLQRQSEQALNRAAQREAELRTMLDAFPGVALRVEGNGTISYCNPRAAALLGLQAPTLEGQHARILLGEKGYQECCSRNLHLRAGGAPLSFEMVVKCPQGTLHELLMTQFLVATEPSGGHAAYQLGVDIGERKRAEAALAQAKSEAERANRAKSRVMSTISHELRTPLNAVLGLTQMLRAPGAQSDAQQQLHLQAIAEAGKDLLALVNETLDLSRIDAGDMRVSCEPVNLADVVRAVLGSLAPLAAEQGVTLAPAPSLRQLWVHADPVRLRQVLLNLLSNAIKYNRRGGGVAVRLVRRGTDAHLVVQDTGQGLTLEQQAQLFQPFNRLGAQHTGVPGTGIGLSIAHGLVALMKGRMDVRSQPGVGSEFMVWLPALDVQPQAGVQRPVHSLRVLEEDFSLHGRVLYVEDNEVNVLVFQACLARRPNVALRVARNGAEALAILAREAVDLVVLDLNLPDQSGLQLADALRQQGLLPQVPMVLLTADATSQTAHRALAHGIHCIWHKPFDAARLLSDVDAMLRETATA
jgi:PAS domain S-box-containing protein